MDLSIIIVGKVDFVISIIYKLQGGTRYGNWLTQCPTSRKVVGSIPNKVIGHFNLRTCSSRTLSLGSTQPLTEMNTRNLPVGSRAAGT
jgi:hypothetical protein